MARQPRDDWSHRDYYVVLDVPATASQDEINRAYRRRARLTHPDLNADDPLAEHRFDELAAAREVLTDPAARAAYDKLRKARSAPDDRAAAVAPPVRVLGRQARSRSGMPVQPGPVVWRPSEVSGP